MCHLKVVRLMIAIEEYQDEVGGRKSYSLQFCTGIKTLSMITITVALNHWSKLHKHTHQHTHFAGTQNLFFREMYY